MKRAKHLLLGYQKNVEMDPLESWKKVVKPLLDLVTCRVNFQPPNILRYLCHKPKSI
jgi:hypothetical protein